MADPDILAKAIARALHVARERGETPIAIILSPATARHLQETGFGYWTAGPGHASLFNLPVEVDSSSEGWTVKTG